MTTEELKAIQDWYRGLGPYNESQLENDVRALLDEVGRLRGQGDSGDGQPGMIFWPLWVGMIASIIIWIALEPAPSAQRRSDYNVVVISGCEYIEHPGYHYFLTHKANCTNSIHGP